MTMTASSIASSGATELVPGKQALPTTSAASGFGDILTGLLPAAPADDAASSGQPAPGAAEPGPLPKAPGSSAGAEPAKAPAPAVQDAAQDLAAAAQPTPGLDEAEAGEVDGDDLAIAADDDFSDEVADSANPAAAAAGVDGASAAVQAPQPAPIELQLLATLILPAMPAAPQPQPATPAPTGDTSTAAPAAAATDAGLLAGETAESQALAAGTTTRGRPDNLATPARRTGMVAEAAGRDGSRAGRVATQADIKDAQSASAAGTAAASIDDADASTTVDMPAFLAPVGANAAAGQDVDPALATSSFFQLMPAAPGVAAGTVASDAPVAPAQAAPPTTKLSPVEGQKLDLAKDALEAIVARDPGPGAATAALAAGQAASPTPAQPAPAAAAAQPSTSAGATAPVLPSLSEVHVGRVVHLTEDRVAIVLDPPELGALHVSLHGRKGRDLTATITVERPETLALLQKESDGMNRVLAEAGINLAGGGLQLALRQEGGNGQPNQNPSSFASHLATAPETGAGASTGTPAERPRTSSRLLDLIA